MQSERACHLFKYLEAGTIDRGFDNLPTITRTEPELPPQAEGEGSL